MNLQTTFRPNKSVAAVVVGCALIASSGCEPSTTSQSIPDPGIPMEDIAVPAGFKVSTRAESIIHVNVMIASENMAYPNVRASVSTPDGTLLGSGLTDANGDVTLSVAHSAELPSLRVAAPAIGLCVSDTLLSTETSEQWVNFR